MGTHGITTYNPTTLEVTNQVSICATCRTKNTMSLWGSSLLPLSETGRRWWDALLLDSCATLFNPIGVRSSVAVFGPVCVHGLGTGLHLSPVAAHRSVRQQSIAIWFEPQRRGIGHAKNSTAKCFRETTNPEIQLSSYKLKDTIRKKYLKIIFNNFKIIIEKYWKIQSFFLSIAVAASFNFFSFLLTSGSSGLMETSVVSVLSGKAREQSSTLHFAKALARSRKRSSFPRNTGQSCSQKHWWEQTVGAASASVQRLFNPRGPTWA